MNRSESLTAIAPALLAAQKQIGAAKKDATNPFFHSSYADLGSVMEACKNALNENGITVLQPIGSDESGVYVETVLLHESGEFIADRMRIAPKSDANPQDQGSAITYARRYSLQSMVFIPAEDDDGNRASGKVASPQSTGYVPKPRYAQPPAKPANDIPTPVQAVIDTQTKGSDITNDQKVHIISLLGKKGKSLEDLQNALKAFKKESYQDLTKTQADSLIAKMESLPDAKDAVNVDEIPDILNEKGI